MGINQPVMGDVASEARSISHIQQGTAVYQCTGTTVFAKSVYVQAELKLDPRSFIDGADPPPVFVPPQDGNARVFAGIVKAKNVRFVVFQDRAPNGTVARISDIYKMAANLIYPPPAPPNPQTHGPNISWISGNAGGASATATLMLDPDKSRRFKILMNEVVTLTLDTPIAFVEKYIPLNFFITYAGNSAAPTPEQIITNGIYILCFTEGDLSSQENSARAMPRYAYTAKLRFEP